MPVFGLTHVEEEEEELELNSAGGGGGDDTGRRELVEDEIAVVVTALDHRESLEEAVMRRKEFRLSRGHLSSSESGYNLLPSMLSRVCLPPSICKNGAALDCTKNWIASELSSDRRRLFLYFVVFQAENRDKSQDGEEREEEEEEGNVLGYEEAREVEMGMEDIEELVCRAYASTFGDFGERMKRLRSVRTEQPRPCSICLDDFLEQGEACLLPCSHVYHHHCIVTWLSNNNSCPLCRSSLIEYGHGHEHRNEDQHEYVT